MTDDAPDIIMMPPLAAIGSLLTCLVLHFIWKPWWVPGFPNPWMIVLGIALIALGFAIAHSATTQFQDAETNVDPTKPATTIVLDGPYKYTRNPMYVGLLLIHFGIGLGASLDWTLVITPALWAFLHFGVVLREEDYLKAKFGSDYEALLKQTRRWI